MSIGLDWRCIRCHLNRSLDVVASLGDEATNTAFTKELLALLLSAPENANAPWLGPATSDLMLKYYGIEIDRFRQEKESSNRFVLERMELLRQKVTAAADPVAAGLRFAILGNYLDFAALGKDVSFDRLDEMLDSALSMELDERNYVNFIQDLETGKKLLYLTDNAGEIGFDRIFGEVLAARYPHLEITFCVRGGIAQNDATREDAAAVGIPFPVIDNGTRIAGTQIDLLGQEAREALESADVILSKGQANVEPMQGCGYNVYYAFLIKCHRFEERFGKPKLTPMLVRERQ